MKIFLRSIPTLFVYSFVSASWLLMGYLLQPYTAQGSVKWIGLFAVLFAALAGLTWLQARFWVAPLWKTARKRQRIIWAGMAVLLGLAGFALLTPARMVVLDKFPIFAPLEQVEVRPVLGPGEDLTIQRIKITDRQVESSSLALEGVWQPDGVELRTADPGARLVLTAHIPYSVDISFLRSPSAGKAIVTWAGKQEQIDLGAEAAQAEVYTFDFERAQLPLATLWVRLLTLPAWIGVAFAACGVLFIVKREK